MRFKETDYKDDTITFQKIKKKKDFKNKNKRYKLDKKNVFKNKTREMEELSNLYHEINKKQ